MIRVFRHYISSIYVVIFLLDCGIFFSAFYMGSVLRFFPDFQSSLSAIELTNPSALFCTFMLASTTGMGLYQRAQHGGDAGLLLRVLASFVLGTVLMGLVFYAIPTIFVGRGVFGYALLSALVLTLFSRFLFLKFVDRQELRRRVLVLGAGYNANMIQEFENKASNPSFRVIGFVQMGGDVSRIEPHRLCALEMPLNEFAIAHDIDEIVVAPDDRRGGLAVDEILDCKMNGLEVVDLLHFFEREAGLIR
ncbi:MAG: hypothetical protein LOY00_05995, partial [Methylocaldum sp.]|nr:hypothetical protein [Methylocaldum sp.]